MSYLDRVTDDLQKQLQDLHDAVFGARTTIDSDFSAEPVDRCFIAMRDVPGEGLYSSAFRKRLEALRGEGSIFDAYLAECEPSQQQAVLEHLAMLLKHCKEAP